MKTAAASDLEIQNGNRQQRPDEGENDFSAAHTLYKEMKEGTQYYLAVGGHSATVRKKGGDYYGLKCSQNGIATTHGARLNDRH